MLTRKNFWSVSGFRRFEDMADRCIEPDDFFANCPS